MPTHSFELVFPPVLSCLYSIRVGAGIWAPLVKLFSTRASRSMSAKVVVVVVVVVVLVVLVTYSK